MIEINKGLPAIRIFTLGKDLIEGNAIEQLKKTAHLDGIIAAAGMPDLHLGKGGPVGAAFAGTNYIYPHLVGNDIGCGMGLWKTSIKKQKIKMDQWVKKLTAPPPFPGDRPGQFSGEPVPGTIGGGNHFAELMVPETVMDNRAFESLGLDETQLCILVHSGSRGIGESILRSHIDKYGAGGLKPGTKPANAYMEKHDFALEWARENRAAIARNVVEKLGGKCVGVLDLCHNSITLSQTKGSVCWLHRKGAAPSDNGMVVIPGSRGTLTYLVKPLGSQELNLFSLPHGAGRKWNRKSCKARLQGKFTRSSLTRTRLGSRVICNNKDLLFEEAPKAFKNIKKIIENLCRQGLVEVVATFRPVITYKN